ncbi:MAG: MFS transporter [Hyphomicrobiales bacterium]
MPSDSSTTSLPLPRKAGALTFSAIFALESLARSLNSTVVSIQAYDILGVSQKVSELSTAVSLSVLTATLLLPYVLGKLRRRWAYSLGIALLIAASLALASFTLEGLAAGMFLRNCGAATLNITLSLYILDHIKRSELARAEPLRLSLSTFSWMVGPAAGVWLYSQYGPAAAQAAAIATAAALFGLFRYLRLSARVTLPSGTLQPFNPLANVRRFAAQPRLRLAWLIAFGRSCFWTSFFIYGPLLIIEGGLGQQFGGLVISASQAMLLSAYVSGRLARRHGVRIVIALAFAAAALASLAAGIAGKDAPYLAAFLLLIGSAAASALDGVGGIPFLRAVKPHDRQRMTAVYRTHIDFSELIPSFVFVFALSFFEIGSVFVILGAGLAIIGAVSWKFLPRSM